MNAPIDVTNIYIETDRLILRAWQEHDLQDFYEYASVDGVGQMAGWKPHESIEITKKILNSFIKNKRTFALELKDNQKVVGSIGLEPRVEEACLSPELLGREVGYVLNKDYWGNGLMVEAVRAVIDYCFNVLDYDFFLCAHYLWNFQSHRVIEKCGFQFLLENKMINSLGNEEIRHLYVLYNPNKER